MSKGVIKQNERANGNKCDLPKLIFLEPLSGKDTNSTHTYTQMTTINLKEIVQDMIVNSSDDLLLQLACLMGNELDASLGDILKILPYLGDRDAFERDRKMLQLDEDQVFDLPAIEEPKF